MNSREIKLQILLPVFNEESCIEKTLEEIHLNLEKRINYQFIISEDGSTDRTKNILNKLKDIYNFILISDIRRKGYSKAVMDGMSKATTDYLMIIDSDGQCDSSEIYNFWKIRKDFDIISGNRVERKDLMYRKIFSRTANLIYKILFNVPLNDPGYACVLMNKKVYNSLRNYEVLCEQGFFWEFHARAKIKNFSFKELNVNHKLRKQGRTQIYYLRNLPIIAIKHFWAFLKIKFSVKS